MTTATLQKPTDSVKSDVKGFEARTLLIKDRCDRCGARAYIRAISSASLLELQFCYHHGRESTPSLIAQGFMIDDQSESLFKSTKPDGGSAAG